MATSFWSKWKQSEEKHHQNEKKNKRRENSTAPSKSKWNEDQRHKCEQKCIFRIDKSLCSGHVDCETILLGCNSCFEFKVSTVHFVCLILFFFFSFELFLIEPQYDFTIRIHFRLDEIKLIARLSLFSFWLAVLGQGKNQIYTTYAKTLT